MKIYIYIIVVSFLVSCTSNTMYEKPKGLIPKDTMVYLLTDLFIAASARQEKNIYLKRRENYLPLVYQKFKIDSLRFYESNIYYTSKIEVYDEILKAVKRNVDTLQKKYEKELRTKDSLDAEKRKEIKDEVDTIVPTKTMRFKKNKSQFK
ncbi:conserved hypothetical protein [Tenacibaculum maritimum]|uniref:DUF4296 domain-containing protein n=2 Tax=Tenacibaculum maritimum TaxID=107401 RepID=A0A2H1EDS5_9FLAO|nr:conserved hypothetical protein [Tenacibaculum maritimum]SFZ85028.1 conserved protein of unknown function [Tenacibaculum maritimum NCIMB 2154]CAA0200422.1 conserved hypothetical protein [Tenacibaculum maritimum]CAA0212531.1 conserved hypothetical protein [Tenacibaculum maritimum]CAA0227162.1 conserved hypothetical protein [Tenacibaculum maritimum]